MRDSNTTEARDRSGTDREPRRVAAGTPASARSVFLGCLQSVPPTAAVALAWMTACWPSACPRPLPATQALLQEGAGADGPMLWSGSTARRQSPVPPSGHRSRRGPRRGTPAASDRRKPAPGRRTPPHQPDRSRVKPSHTARKALAWRLRSGQRGARKGHRGGPCDTVNASTKRVVYKTADFHKPWDIGVTPGAAIQARIDQLNAQLAPILGTVIGQSTVFVPRTDACGNTAGRTCESLEGNVTADAMRTTYGTDFAITNSGGLRADLTCPTNDNPSDFCPAYTPPPFPITRGQVLTVLPFGNVVVTLTVSGAELKTMLENGVSQMPAVAGRFPQVSGLCFAYNISLPAGSRVVSAVVADAAGNCTATPVNLTAAASYKIAENDFMAKAGDGYPDFSARMTTQDVMDQVAADYVAAKSPISPFVKAAPDGRINCIDSNGAAAPNCPALTASP